MSTLPKLGLVGAGRGVGLARYVSQSKLAEVSAVCDPSAPRRETFLKGWKAALPDVPVPLVVESLDLMLKQAAGLDAVLVASPAPLHAGQSIQALRAGVNVFSEIPAAHTLEEARALVQAVHASGKLYYFGENVCFSPGMKLWRRLVSEGRIGEPQYVEGEYVHDVRGLFLDRRTGATTWRFEFDPIRYCTHETGPLLDILEDRIVQAIGVSSTSRTYPNKPVGDIQGAFFRTAKGVVFKQLCAFSVERPGGFHYYSIYGSKGFLETGRDNAAPTFTARLADMPECRALQIPWPDLKPKRESGHGGADWAMMDDFMACLRGDSPLVYDVYRGLDFSLPGIVAAESIRQGSAPLEVPDPREWQ